MIPSVLHAQGVEIIKIDEEAEEFGFDRLGELVKEYKGRKICCWSLLKI